MDGSSGLLAHDARGGIRVHARHVVGADGLGSRVARSVGAPLVLARPTSGAAVYAYLAGDWSGVEYHVGAGALAGVFPTHGGRPASGSAPRRRSPGDTSDAGHAMPCSRACSQS